MKSRKDIGKRRFHVLGRFFEEGWPEIIEGRLASFGMFEAAREYAQKAMLASGMVRSGVVCRSVAVVSDDGVI